MYPQFDTPLSVAKEMAKAAKNKRLSFNMTQESLSERSGVSLGTLKKFEYTGKISLESLLKIATILKSLDDFSGVFKPTPPESYSSLDELLKQKVRKRGRK
ncbi:MAG: helix-turn-helix transcriptional regulator [Gammaproteobacteria bacterium]|nr:helix-turn-helix transcriptional regulator [Gammaproteobacteria bacterium]